MANLQQLMTPQQANDTRVCPYSFTQQEASKYLPIGNSSNQKPNFQPQKQEEGLSFYQKLKLTKSQKTLQVEGVALCSAPTQGINQIARPNTT